MLRAVLLLLLLSVALAGCIPSFGKGGTGELVIPRKRLRRIEPLDLSAFSRPLPPGMPPVVEPLVESGPTTRPDNETGNGMALGPATAPTAGPTTGPTTGPASEPANGFAPGAAPPRPATRPAGPPAPEVALTVADVRRLALENNLDLKVELLNPAIARTSLTEEEDRYEALFVANASFAKTDAAVASQLTGSQTDSRSLDAGLEIPLRTGGRVRLNVPVSRFETNNQFSTLNPAFTSEPAVTISQPLLRGAGFDVNAQSIRIAFYGYQQAQARAKLEVTRVLADAERSYWRLYAARQELQLREAEYNLSVALLEQARRLFRVGRAPEPDVVRAESGVADRVEAIILAENAVRDRERELKRTLNTPGLEVDAATVPVPITQPLAVAYNLDGPALARAALDGRMELVEEELRIAQETASIRVARNDTLPLVSLEYTYNVNGLGPSLDDALSQVREKRFEDHRVGVRVEVPIGNAAAESRLRRSILNRYQALATKELREVQIKQEVLAAADQLASTWQRILAARQRVVLAARVFETERRLFREGLRTSTDVLDAQTRLADARLSEISAVTEYQIAQVDIAFATGTVLGAGRVVWDPTLAPDERGRR